MTIEQNIQRKIAEYFGEGSYQLVNESHKHQGHAGDDGSGQTHFRLQITSPRFEGLSRVDAQRLVYQLLDQEFKDGLHALALKIKA